MDLQLEANRNSALFNTMQEVLDVYNPLLYKARPTTVNAAKHRIKVSPTRFGQTLSSWQGERTVRFDLPRIGPILDFTVQMAFRIPGQLVTNDPEATRLGIIGKASDTLTTGGLSNAKASWTHPHDGGGTGSPQPQVMLTGTDSPYGYEAVDPDSATSGCCSYVASGPGNNRLASHMWDTMWGSKEYARGRLDRVYADRFLGFNMIKEYVVSSKSREIFRADAEYLLLRFSQLPKEQKDAIFKAVTPKDVMSKDINDMFYQPGVVYQMSIPLWLFFNEHISSALDVNFTEEVHIDLVMRSPSELFWYGQIGHAYFDYKNLIEEANAIGGGFENFNLAQLMGLETQCVASGVEAPKGPILPWDQSKRMYKSGGHIAWSNESAADGDWTNTECFEPRYPRLEFGGTVGLSEEAYDRMIQRAANSIRSAGPGSFPSENNGYAENFMAFVKRSLVEGNAGAGAGTSHSLLHRGQDLQQISLVTDPTFRFNDVDNNGESIQVMFEGVCDFLIQDTDTQRALRSQMYPEGSGLTQITFNTARESYQQLMNTTNSNILAEVAGGSTKQVATQKNGISVGDKYVDINLKANNLTQSTSFMVRLQSDLWGDNHNEQATNPDRIIDPSEASTPVLEVEPRGSRRVYSRCIPVHYFQLLSSGRIIYESDAEVHLNLTQANMYPGTGLDISQFTPEVDDSRVEVPDSEAGKRPLYIYTLNHGLQSSRLENTGCLSLQNLNNPTLRLYFKPEVWDSMRPYTTSKVHKGVLTSADNAVAFGATKYPIEIAGEKVNGANMGLQVDLIHEYFSVVTINTGNGEITSGLNQ